MPRRRRPESREILPDPVYNSTLAEKFVNSMMWDGKKAVSQRIFYGAMDKIKERSGDDPLKLFKKAVENCKPLWKSRPAAWAAPTTRFQWRCRTTGAPRWRSVGFCQTPG